MIRRKRSRRVSRRVGTSVNPYFSVKSLVLPWHRTCLMGKTGEVSFPTTPDRAEPLDRTLEKENSMGFYGPEPFTTATATYVWMGLGSPGAFFVEVSGD